MGDFITSVFTAPINAVSSVSSALGGPKLPGLASTVGSALTNPVGAFKATKGGVQLAAKGIRDVGSAIDKNPYLKAVKDVYMTGVNYFTTGGVSLLNQGNDNDINKSIKSSLTAVDVGTGAKGRREEKAGALAAAQAAQESQLATYNKEQSDNATRSAAQAAAQVARNRQLTGKSGSRRSTILTGPRGLDGGISIGGVKGYGTLLGGGY